MARRERSPKAIQLRNEQKALTQKRRFEIAEMRLSGKTRKEVAEITGLSPTTISHHLKAATEEWRERAFQTIDQWKAELVAKYDRLYRDVLSEWERSKRDAETRTVELCGLDEKGRPKKKVTYRKEWQTGNPALVEKAMSALESIRKVLGIDAPRQTEITGMMGILEVHEEIVTVRQNEQDPALSDTGEIPG